MSSSSSAKIVVAAARRTESSSTTASTRTETMDNTTGTTHTAGTSDGNEDDVDVDVEMSMNRDADTGDGAERNDDGNDHDDNSDENDDDGPTDPLVRHWSFLTADTDATVISPPMLTRRESFVQSVRAGTVRSIVLRLWMEGGEK